MATVVSVDSHVRRLDEPASTKEVRRAQLWLRACR